MLFTAVFKGGAYINPTRVASQRGAVGGSRPEGAPGVEGPARYWHLSQHGRGQRPQTPQGVGDTAVPVSLPQFGSHHAAGTVFRSGAWLLPRPGHLQDPPV